MKNKLFRAILIALLLVGTVTLFPQRKGVELIEEQLGPDVKIGKQYLVLIAIDRYQEWLPLKNSVKDIKEIRSILESRYYIDKTFPLYDENATNEKIITLFKQLQQELKPEDSLLLYYSGHGYYEKSSTTGYWIPVDGGKNVNRQDRWINNNRIKGFIGKIKSKHILLISDSCFSGQLLDLKKGDDLPVIDNNYFKRAYLYRARQVLTSGALETVPDDSIFAGELKSLLKENNEPILAPLTVYDNIRRGMRNGNPFPLFGELKGTGHQTGGSFLLFLKQNQAPPKLSPINTESLEIEAKWAQWQKRFQGDVDRLKKYDENPDISNESKKASWEKLLKRYGSNNPYSSKDEELRNYAEARVQHWQNKSNLLTANLDICIKVKSHSDKYKLLEQTTPAEDFIYTTWISDNKYAKKYKNFKTVIRLDKNTIYLIDHSEKTFVVAPIPLNMQKVVPNTLMQAYSKATASLTINPKGQTKKIGYWNCSGYDMQMTNSNLPGTPLKMKSTIWTTTEVPFDWKTVNNNIVPILLKLSILSASPSTQKIRNELQKINGYIVATETSMEVMGSSLKSNTFVMEIVKKAPPVGTYDVPEGYTQKERLSETWGQ